MRTDQASDAATANDILQYVGRVQNSVIRILIKQMSSITGAVWDHPRHAFDEVGSRELEGKNRMVGHTLLQSYGYVSPSNYAPRTAGRT